jgi:hypothetical protein
MMGFFGDRSERKDSPQVRSQPAVDLKYFTELVFGQPLFRDEIIREKLF